MARYTEATERIGLAYYLMLPVALLRWIIGLFITADHRERREIEKLYEEAQRLYDVSPFAETEREEIASACVVDACERAGRYPSPSLLEQMFVVVELFMFDEGLWSEPTFEWSASFELEHKATIRKGYRAKIRFFCNYEQNMKLWQEVTISVLAAIIERIPPTALNVSEQDDGRSLSFQVPLIALMDEPAEFVERLTGTFFKEDIKKLELFQFLRDQIEINACYVSGIDPNHQNESKKPVLLPTELKGKTAVEIAQAYFGGTTLELLLTHPLPFSIPEKVRFEHCHILGGTGHGKTQLLQLLIYQDLLKAKDDGRSVIVIDSQGDLINTISRLSLFAPDHTDSLADRLILVDPNDIEYPVALNMFDCNRERMEGYGAADRERLLNGTISLYSYLFGALLGAELTDKQGVIFKYLARLMMVIPGATIHTMRELMEDAEPFRKYLDFLDGTTRKFFETQFFSRSFAQTKQQIARRLWSVLSYPTLDRMFSHPRTSIDLFQAINSGKIILINTAKDLLKEDGSQVIGRFFISMIVQAALERATIPADKRKPCLVYIDEAHEYFDQSIGDLLNQARKYNVALILSHQNLDQLSSALRATMMTNTSVKLVGGVSSKDARVLADEMNCKPSYLQGIRKREDETEFACWIRNILPHPLTLSVPLGAVERQETLSSEQYEALIAKNRRRYCKRVENALTPRSSSVAAPDEVLKRKVSIEVPAVSEPQNEHVETAPKLKKHLETKSEEPSPMGQGGQKHIYLQTLIKRCAEERGYRAVIEKPTPDGSGKVDISLEKGDQRIACEVSVTTTVEHELGNVRKCLSAGYVQVLLVAADKKRVRALREYILSQLNEAERHQVSFLLPDEVIMFLDQLAVTSGEEEKTVRGYKVNISRTAVGTEEMRERRQAIAKVIARSISKAETGEGI